LFSIYFFLIVTLFISNWIGIRERYVTEIFPTINAKDTKLADVNPNRPGKELILLTSSGIYIINDFSANRSSENAYSHPNADENPLIAFAVGDFNPQQKAKEIMVLSANGTLIHIEQIADNWRATRLDSLPWQSPVWTTHSVVAGQIITNSSAEEFIIIGDHFDWPTMNHTGRVMLFHHPDNGTWQLEEIFQDSNPLLCAAIGNLYPSPGLEVIIGGESGTIWSFDFNATWNVEPLFTWRGAIQSLTMGEFMWYYYGTEIACVLDHEGFILRRAGTQWQPQQIWRSDQRLAELNQILSGDVDPYHPGDELLCRVTASTNHRSILYFISNDQYLWNIHYLETLWTTPIDLQIGNINFNRDGDEIFIINDFLISVLSIPNDNDRTIKAGYGVLLPAVILFPLATLLFALADYIGRAAERRRRQYALEMVAKGFARCPYCRRWIPRDKMEAHRRSHVR
jgi:hypothetical protein